jgi:hypothetical protein
MRSLLIAGLVAGALVVRWSGLRNVPLGMIAQAR